MKLLGMLILLIGGCASAQTETCGVYGKADNDEITRKATIAFNVHTHGRISEYQVLRKDCTSKSIIMFDGVDKDANFGNHWMVIHDKSTGEFRVIDGM